MIFDSSGDVIALKSSYRRIISISLRSVGGLLCNEECLSRARYTRALSYINVRTREMELIRIRIAIALTERRSRHAVYYEDNFQTANHKFLRTNFFTLNDQISLEIKLIFINQIYYKRNSLYYSKYFIFLITFIERNC